MGERLRYFDLSISFIQRIERILNVRFDTVYVPLSVAACVLFAFVALSVVVLRIMFVEHAQRACVYSCFTFNVFVLVCVLARSCVCVCL